MFTDKLAELINLKCNGKQTVLAENTGISQATISCYFTRGSLPSAEQLIKLADFFEVSIDYLLGRENDFGIIQSNVSTLTKEESELLATFKLLTLEDQYKAIGFVKALAY